MDVIVAVAWFKNTILGNEVWRFVAWLSGVLVAVLVGRILRHHLKQIASAMEQRQKPMAAVFLRAAARAVVFALVTIALDTGLHFLVLNATTEALLATVMRVLIVVATTYVIHCVVDAVCRAWALAASKTPSKMDDMLVPIVRRTLQVTVVILGLVQAATVLSDKPLTSILAGLGVGGLAIALAAQETIKHFFGSVTVLTDKPFELGDRIVVDKFDGQVVEVGFRSTRIRTLDGDLVTIPNGDLASRSILNSGRRPFFRRVINIGLAYDTPPAKIQRALQIVRDLLANQAALDPRQPPRVYFTEFTPTALNLMAVYWYSGMDYWKYLEFSERINLEILERFGSEGICLAVLPVQSVAMGGSERK